MSQVSDTETKVEALDKATGAVMHVWDSGVDFSWYDVRAALAPFFAPQPTAEPQTKGSRYHDAGVPNTVFVDACPSTPVPHWCDPAPAEQSEPAKDEARKRS